MTQPTQIMTADRALAEVHLLTCVSDDVHNPACVALSALTERCLTAPSSVTARCDSCRAAEGPATVTLTDDSLDALSKAFNQDVLAGEFDAIPTLVERLTEALTAGLAAAREDAAEWKQRAHDHAHAAHRREVERDAARHHAITAQEQRDTPGGYHRHGDGPACADEHAERMRESIDRLERRAEAAAMDARNELAVLRTARSQLRDLSALPADLAAAERKAADLHRAAAKFRTQRDEAEQVIANVRALADEWAAGNGHSPLDDWYATELRDLLPAAPSGGSDA